MVTSKIKKFIYLTETKIKHQNKVTQNKINTVRAKSVIPGILGFSRPLHLPGDFFLRDISRKALATLLLEDAMSTFSLCDPHKGNKTSERGSCQH